MILEYHDRVPSTIYVNSTILLISMFCYFYIIIKFQCQTAQGRQAPHWHNFWPGENESHFLYFKFLAHLLQKTTTPTTKTSKFPPNYCQKHVTILSGFISYLQNQHQANYRSMEAESLVDNRSRLRSFWSRLHM